MGVGWVDRVFGALVSGFLVGSMGRKAKGLPAGVASGVAISLPLCMAHVLHAFASLWILARKGSGWRP